MKSKTATKQIVTKDMTIGEVVNKYPESAQVMLDHGLHCIGCAVNPYESIENGCLGHGMSEETINDIISEINETIKKSSNTKEKKISISDNAAEKFREFMKEEKMEGYGIRLGVFGGGCSGFQYTLDFAEKPNKTEDVFEDKGIKIFFDKSISNNISGTRIDFVSNESGSGFKIDNPNSVSSECGCSN